MGTGRLDPAAVERLHRRAHADRWAVSRDAFAEALERSVRRALPGAALDAREAHRYLDSLHLEDLALAVACAASISRLAMTVRIS